MKFVSLFILFFVLTACTTPNASVQFDPDVTMEEPTNLNQIGKTTEQENQAFEVPNGWHFRETNSEINLPREPKKELLLINTERKVLLGAVLPENIDSSEYADSYIAIKTLVYENEVDFADLSWQEFFSDFYPEVQAFVSLPLLRDNLEAVTVTETDGVWLGTKRIFVRAGDRFYDLSLHYQNADPSEAEVAWNNFFNNYDF